MCDMELTFPAVSMSASSAREGRGGARGRKGVNVRTNHKRERVGLRMT